VDYLLGGASNVLIGHQRGDHLGRLPRLLAPGPEAEPGDPVVCEVCGRKFGATLPPMEETPDPWRGDGAYQVAPHWHAGPLAPQRKA
jgi:hypothetical protein